jgi:hypothetical protein
LRDVSRRSWRASHLRSRRRQQRRQPPRRRPTASGRRPHRLLSRCPRRHRRRLHPPHKRRPHQPHQWKLHQQHRRHRLRQQLVQPNSQPPRKRRQVRVQACRARRARLHPPQGSATAQPPRHDRVLAQLEGFLVRQVRLPAVPAPPDPATTRSPLRREWVSRERRVQAPTVAGPQHPVRLLAAADRSRALAPDCPACRGPIRR